MKNRAVSDSTLLIHLSKIGGLHLLKSLFDEIIIPKGVYHEVIAQGKNQSKNEIIHIKSLIDNKFIVVKTPQSLIKIESLDRGEKECISLCKNLEIDCILIDEKVGFNIARMFGLKPMRVTEVLLRLLNKKIISSSKYKELLKMLLQTGYFLHASIYDKLLSEGENFAKK